MKVRNFGILCGFGNVYQATAGTGKIKNVYFLALFITYIILFYGSVWPFETQISRNNI
jgi:uncharacterized membrane protein YtjA (UPF0391 family)